MGKEEQRPKPIHLRAVTERKWIVMGKKWYTPDEFFREFGKGLSLPPGSWRLADPLDAVKEGREKFTQMITEEQSYAKIQQAFDRLYKFSDKIFQEYRYSNRDSD